MRSDLDRLLLWLVSVIKFLRQPIACYFHLSILFGCEFKGKARIAVLDGRLLDPNRPIRVVGKDDTERFIKFDRPGALLGLQIDPNGKRGFRAT